MRAGRIIVEDAVVIRMVRYGEDTGILSLLSAQSGLFSAGCKLRGGRRARAEGMPLLFASIRACVQEGAEGFRQLRSFATLPGSFFRGPAEHYLRLNWLARMTLLMVRESPQESRFHALWLKALQFPQSMPPLCMLADVHFAHGTWPALEVCERCFEAMEGVHLGRAQFVCRRCAGPGERAASAAQARWLQERYQRRGELELPAAEVKLLADDLLRRLPAPVLEDSLFRKLWQHVLHDKK